jgi:hypothetical protein
VPLPSAPYRKGSWHVKEVYKYEGNISWTKSIISFAQILAIYY